jgi:hypothetical protein
VFENRLLRRIFGPKRDEVTGEWRKLRNEELDDLCSSPNIVRVVKPGRMRWTGHVARMGGRRVYRVLVGKPEGNPGVDGRIILRWVFTFAQCMLLYLFYSNQTSHRQVLQARTHIDNIQPHTK